jgi:hypothetical protein
MARFSGNIEYVAVGKKTEVPLLIASLCAIKNVKEEDDIKQIIKSLFKHQPHTYPQYFQVEHI